MVSNPKSILLDLQKELAGEMISDTFVVRGRKFLMTLLNEEETNWTFMFAKTSNNVSIGFSIRLPTIALSIREINDVPISVMFENDFKAIATHDQIERWEGEYGFDFKKYVYAGLLMDRLKEFPPTFIQELHSSFQSLVDKRDNAQKQLKNSLGEDSEKIMSGSMIESSHIGEK